MELIFLNNQNSQLIVFNRERYKKVICVLTNLATRETLFKSEQTETYISRSKVLN